MPLTPCVRVTGLHGVNFSDVQDPDEHQAIGLHIRVVIKDVVIYGEVARVVDPGIDQRPSLRVFYIISRVQRRQLAFAWDFAKGAGVSLRAAA